MTNNFFENPFDEETNIKLELYGDYLKEWFPVFLAINKPYYKTVNVFDCFCGPGADSEGSHGSPLIALDVLKEYKDFTSRDDVAIHLHFNDVNVKHIEELSARIKEYEELGKSVHIHYYNKDFVDYFPQLLSKVKGAANLIFLDQFGVKYVTKDRFDKLIKLNATDILFFTSSSIFNRFPDDTNVTSIVGMDSQEVKSKPFYEIHRLVHQKFTELIPIHHSYCLAPFSIKKGANIYGLIFGSGHPLGLEKFLKICWEKDNITGEANFDIQGDIIRSTNPTLFDKDLPLTKINSFQESLKTLILSGELKTDLDVYLYMLNSGFISDHVAPVIKELKSEKKIELKYPSFSYSTVCKNGRTPQMITLL